MPQAKNDLAQTTLFLHFYKKSLQSVYIAIDKKENKTSDAFYKRNLERMDAMLVLGYMIQKVDVIIRILSHLKSILPEHKLKELDDLIGEQIKRFHDGESLVIKDKLALAFVEVTVQTTPKNRRSLSPPYVQRSGDYLVDYIHEISLKFLKENKTNHGERQMIVSGLDWMIFIPLTFSFITLCVVASMFGFFVNQNTMIENSNTDSLPTSLCELSKEYKASFILDPASNNGIQNSDTVYDDTRNTGKMCEIQNTFEGNRLIKKARLSENYHILFHHFPCLGFSRTISQKVDKMYMKLNTSF